MKLGIRGKLFAISVALIACVGIFSGLYLERELRDQLEEDVETELYRNAAVARAVIESGSYRPGDYDAIADNLASAMDSRITILAADGRVLGDSEIAGADLTRMENHAGRPEVVGAQETGRGFSRRFSHTIDKYLLYVAVTYQHGDMTGVVRAARPLVDVDEAVSRLHVLFLLAGLFGLLVAVVMSGLASHLMSLTLRELDRRARAMAARPLADASGQIRLSSLGDDEIAGLGGSLQRMARSIKDTVRSMATERARFEAVLASMEAAVIMLDGERCITLMNRAALAFLGLDEPPLGRPFIECLRTPAIVTALEEPRATRSCEIDLGGLGGPGEPGGPSSRRVLARVSPERDGDGFILVMYDVTSLRRLEAVSRDFTANVSHELRTPVSVIRANAETLLDGAIDDPVHGKELLEALGRNAERLARLLEDLLDLARIEAGRYEIRKTEISVASAVKKAMESVEQAAHSKNLSLTGTIDADLCIAADDKALDQILVNLLDNAVKYTPAGGRVEVSACVDGDSVRIDVADDGPGIAPHHRKRVFERFYRVDPGRSRDMGGTGLGLSIVKHLAEAMSGRVGVAGRKPRGSCFWIELPRA